MNYQYANKNYIIHYSTLVDNLRIRHYSAINFITINLLKPPRKETPLRFRRGGFYFEKRADDDLLSHGRSHTTIGAMMFHF